MFHQCFLNSNSTIVLFITWLAYLYDVCMIDSLSRCYLLIIFFLFNYELHANEYMCKSQLKDVISF